MSNQQRQGGFQYNQNYYNTDNAFYPKDQYQGAGLSNQSKKQHKQELAQQIEMAARIGDSETLENIMDNRGDEVQYLKKEIHKALLQTVLNCSSAKKDNYIECIRILNGAGANIDAEDSSDGKTALMIACEKGYVELVAELILLEAQVNIKDKKGRTPIFYALEAPGENLDVVMQLLKKGADVNIVSVDGWSPLLKATHKQYNQILKKLIEQGALVSQKTSNQNTALHIATDLADVEALQLLLHHGAGRDLVTQNKDKETPLMIAQRNASKDNQHKDIYLYLQQVVEEQEEKSKKAKDELVMQEDEERERRKIKQKQRENAAKYQQFKEDQDPQNEDEDLQDEGPAQQHESNSPGSQGYLKTTMTEEEYQKVQNSPQKLGEEAKSYGQAIGAQQFQQQEWPLSASNKKQPQSKNNANGSNANNAKKNGGGNGGPNHQQQFNQSTNQHSARVNHPQNNTSNELPQDLNVSRNNQSFKGQKQNNTQQQIISPMGQQNIPNTSQQVFNNSQQQQMHHQQNSQGLAPGQSRNQQNQQKYNKSLPFPTNQHQQQMQQQQQQHSPQIHPQPSQGTRYATPQIAPQQQLPQVMNGVQVAQGMNPGMMIISQPQPQQVSQQQKQQVIMNNQPNPMPIFSMPLSQQQMAIMTQQLPPSQQQLQQTPPLQPQQHQVNHQYPQQQQNSARMYHQQQQPAVLSHQNSQSQQRSLLPIEETINLSSETDQKIFVLQATIMKLEGALHAKDKEIALYKNQSEFFQRQNNDSLSKLEQADKDIEFRIQQEYQMKTQYQYLQNELTCTRVLLDQQKQHMQSQLEQNKERRIEIEKLLINICTKYKTLVETIIVKNKDKTQFSDHEIKTIEKDLNESQEAFNQFLIPESPTIPSTYGGSHQFQVVNQGAPSAIDDRLLPKQNMLIRMMDRFENQNAQQLDQSEVFKRLSEEILVFRESVRDILAEMQPIKEQLIKNISQIIKKAIQNSDVQVYGSHATKLCLPLSDIDLVIVAQKENGITSHPKNVLSMIARELQIEVANSWVKSVNYVENASVPVIKLSCNVEQIISQFPQLSQGMIKYKPFLEQPFNIDITQLTENHNGLECVKLVQEFLAENEVIEPLVLVLKHYLKVCNYNDPYFGGISSYALFLMIVSYLQSQNVPKELSKVNLGKLLISFFEFYGDFQHIHYGVYTCSPGKIPEKQNQFPIVNFNSQCIQIEDPLHSHNNVGKSSFKFLEIKESFQFTGQVAFIGCFCECHNEKLHIEKARQNMLDTIAMGQERMNQKGLGLRKCDSVLSKVIYSYMQYLIQHQ